MIYISLFLSVLLSTVQSFRSNFNHRSSIINNRNGLTLAMSWPKTRPPVPNAIVYKQKMDAAWGRGRYR